MNPQSITDMLTDAQKQSWLEIVNTMEGYPEDRKNTEYETFDWFLRISWVKYHKNPRILEALHIARCGIVRK